jgi:hypothetical protein
MGFKKKGTVVIQFSLIPGSPRREFMSRLETGIEAATAKLLDEGRTSLES